MRKIAVEDFFSFPTFLATALLRTINISYNSNLELVFVLKQSFMTLSLSLYLRYDFRPLSWWNKIKPFFWRDRERERETNKIFSIDINPLSNNCDRKLWNRNETNFVFFSSIRYPKELFECFVFWLPTITLSFLLQSISFETVSIWSRFQDLHISGSFSFQQPNLRSNLQIFNFAHLHRNEFWTI